LSLEGLGRRGEGHGDYIQVGKRCREGGWEKPIIGGEGKKKKKPYSDSSKRALGNRGKVLNKAGRKRKNGEAERERAKGRRGGLPGKGKKTFAGNAAARSGGERRERKEGKGKLL